MPLKLYEESSSTTLVLAKDEFKIAGYNFLYELWNYIGTPSYGWSAQNALIQKVLSLKIKSANKLHIVIETMYYSYRIEEIWGWTHVDNTGAFQWMPLLFIGEEIDITPTPNDPDTYNFTLHDIVHEFMYVKGDWNWGSGGPHTSPILSTGVSKWFIKAFM